jgi:hypothetical protein
MMFENQQPGSGVRLVRAILVIALRPPARVNFALSTLKDEDAAA